MRHSEVLRAVRLPTVDNGGPWAVVLFLPTNKEDTMEPSEMSAPQLVREFCDIRCQNVRDAFNGKSTINFSRLDAIVFEMRSRGLLD